MNLMLLDFLDTKLSKYLKIYIQKGDGYLRIIYCLLGGRPKVAVSKNCNLVIGNEWWTVITIHSDLRKKIQYIHHFWDFPSGS